MSIRRTIRLYTPHPRLGRHQILDPRSLEHGVELAATIRPARHDPAIPVLDQEDLHAQGIDVRELFPGARIDQADALGSCVGNASVYALSSLYRDDLSGAGLSATDSRANEIVAIRRYHRATQMDLDLADQYPTVDCGSSGLGSCRAMRKDGLIGSYRWAFSAHGVASLLQSGGVMLGVPWYEAWFDPDSDGFVDQDGWQDSGVVGGHEIYVAELESWNDRDPGQSVIRFVNSWDSSWGDAGSGRLRLSTYDALRWQIDAKQPRR